MRIIVVGASTGLGRCLGIGLSRRGAQVALLARRRELLSDAATEAGPSARAITCDVTDQDACRDAVEEAAQHLGGVDGVVYCPGVGVLSRIEHLDAAAWRRTFDTNVVGASLFTAAVLPHLAASNGTAVYLSSISASFTHPWPGLASYTVTKAAMDKLVEAWRVEHPEVGFTRLVVGDCAGGEGIASSQFMTGWDMDLLGELFPTWMSRGLLSGTVFDQEELVHVVESVLRCGASAAIPTVTMIPRQSPAATSITDLDPPSAALLDS
ncbi:SDR family oxidoreductase [Acidiferrimicrobium sp. IK]|uniref:SDR family oxidoreductase n=1 Tax=Acidiferrimicrobium sp. IK TaxID=2871700 RepID=UPI003966E564